jgi:hypothetical protein
MKMVIKTTELSTKGISNTLVETIESIKLYSTRFTKGLELLTNFENSDK